MDFQVYRGEMTDNKFLMELDNKEMSIPNFECEPQLLISQVRQQYYNHLLKLLSTNYENHQKLVGKNIYLPSAIWRCAKSLENNAAQMCMVLEIYRNNILSLIKQLKTDTKKGRLHRPLLDCLQKPSGNEKHTQTTQKYRTETCTCPCTCNSEPRKSTQPKHVTQMDTFMNNVDITMTNLADKEQNQITDNPGPPQMVSNATHNGLLRNENRISIDSQEQDQMMMQLEELFRDDHNDIEDLFEGVCNMPAVVTTEDTCNNNLQDAVTNMMSTDEQAVSLNERLAMLETSGVLPQDPVIETATKTQNKPNNSNKKRQYKWICEEYYQRLHLMEKLDELRELSRTQHTKVKQLFIELFGDDDDDEEVLSPQDDNPDFILGCKERIAPWVVKQLTPHYVKGRILGKPLFKALAKHLINLVIKCSKYPSDYEVHSFISDFLKNHKLIRCEADFTDFKIDNYYV